MDKTDIPFYFKNLQNEMPIHTDDGCRIKWLFSQRMPKNLIDYSQFMANKALNNNLCYVEEIAHKFKHKPFVTEIINSFRNYSKKHYLNSDILLHDGFFMIGEALMPIALGNLLLGAGGGYKVKTFVAGTELEQIATGDLGVDINMIYCTKMPDGTIGHSYNRAAISLTNSVGNYRLGVYNQISGTANTLYVEQSGGQACDGLYTYRTLAQFDLNTIVNYCAVGFDNASTTGHADIGQPLGSTVTEAKTYANTGAWMSNPISPTNTTSKRKFKLGYL